MHCVSCMLPMALHVISKTPKITKRSESSNPQQSEVQTLYKRRYRTTHYKSSSFDDSFFFPRPQSFGLNPFSSICSTSSIGNPLVSGTKM